MGSTVTFRSLVVLAFSALVTTTASAALVEPPQPTTASKVTLVIYWVPCSAYPSYSIADKVITVNFTCDYGGGCVLPPHHRIDVGQLEAGQYTVRILCNSTELVSTSTFVVSAEIPVM